MVKNLEEVKVWGGEEDEIMSGLSKEYKGVRMVKTAQRQDEGKRSYRFLKISVELL